MAQDYKVAQVSPETRTFSTKFGDMVSYKIKLEGVDEVIELAQKTSSQPPQSGDQLYGSIDTSGSFGPKFKKERRDSFGGGFGGQSQYQTGGGTRTQGTSASSGRFGNSDPFTMYLSYAKDLAVALVATKEGFDEDKYGKLLEAVTVGAKTLYNDRPGAEDSKPEAKKDDLGLSPEDYKEAVGIFDKEEPIEL